MNFQKRWPRISRIVIFFAVLVVSVTVVLALATTERAWQMWVSGLKHKSEEFPVALWFMKLVPRILVVAAILCLGGPAILRWFKKRRTRRST